MRVGGSADRVRRARSSSYAIGPLALLIALAWGAGLLACASRGVALSPAERERLRNSVEEGPVVTGERQLARSHDLHVAGAVECRGVGTKHQLSMGRAWTTKRGTSELAPVLILKVRFEYQTGLFAGSRQEQEKNDAFSASVSEHVSAYGKDRGCSCITVVAEARVPSVDLIRTRKIVCPD